MTDTPPIADPALARWLAACDHPLCPVILDLRKILGGLGLSEGIKWNAPSFARAGTDIITLNLARPDSIRVVFHRGAKAVDTRTGTRLLPDVTGLRWATDQRADAAFTTPQDVAARAEWLAETAHRWIAAA